MKCAVDTCSSPAYCRGWCKAHYQRWYRHGDPLGGGPPRMKYADPMERFLAALPNRSDDDACWLWAGTLDRCGYAKLTVAGRSVNGHRWYYEQVVGPVPDGLELDHLCRVRHCVNPAHLEPVTHKENMRRSHLAAGFAAPWTHCAEGHPMEPWNVYTKPPNGHRECRICRRARKQRYRERLRQGLPAQGRAPSA